MNMLLFIICVTLALLLFFIVGMQKVYANESFGELKRQARKGDTTAELLYRVMSYGLDVDILFWFLISIVSASLFVLLASSMPSWLAIIITAILIWFAFVWLPRTHSSRYMLIVAKYTSPILNWLLNKIQPITKKVRHHASKHLPISIHTNMYEKADLIELLDRQQKQIDNRIGKEELQIAKNALAFGEKKVAEIMTPKRMIKMVSSHDMIGPVLMDELHKSGHSRFPVKHDTPDNIVGTLYIKDVINAKAGGFVKNIMRKDVYYVNQDESLARVLDAFIKTKHHLFLVVNNFEEIVGVISVEDIIEQVLGKQLIDEFDSYDDLRAVAGMQAKKDSQKHENVLKSNEEKDKKGESANSKS